MTTAANSLKKGNVRFPVTESLLLLVAIFWGTSYGLTKSALAYTSVLVFISIRFSITFLCLLPVVIRDFRRGLNKDWKIAIPTGFILSAIFFCEVFGVSQTSASNAAFLISMSVILTAFAELLINKKKVSNTLWGLTACSVAGVLLLTSEESVEFSLNSGDYFILTAALLRALMVTMTKRFTEGKVITTSTLTSLQSLIVALVAIVCAVTYLPTSEFVVPASWEFWLTVIYLVLFCTLFAFYVQNYAVRRTSPTRVSLLMGSEPLFGALFAMAWLQESFTTMQVIGGVLILFSVVVTSTKES
ncbi:DMT family transporter [Vibrio coralliilyticus]|uniref:DMT family transporter n=1 Tax=Vibrio coralliilyticus TaxID=190893 RepID=UPI0003913619|nr:DMT family transporter [Vibrio coralliilyticus]ERB63553.1 membrane protein [Vibrio coralliilyticus OCN008]NOH53575.1 DMT family transporter [Vibrio coralliilyticus]NRF61229.1 DMT family transporter [Vibrio coralliilyticus]QIJ86856.1 DMT family transporter [Vibrio coralliilyticus OCN008]